MESGAVDPNDALGIAADELSLLADAESWSTKVGHLGAAERRERSR